jgi:hypothetical protein
MIKKRIKSIFKLTVLIAARQIWKLLCNLYHLITEPILTIKTLIKERDKSQIFLIIMVIVAPITAYFLARIIWDHYRYGLVVRDVGMFFGMSVSLEIILLAYMGFWIIKAVKRIK